MTDTGTSNWRSTACPSCGNRVTWTVAQAYSGKVACPNESCKFTLARAEWDYIREKGERAAVNLRRLVAAREEAKRQAREDARLARMTKANA
jgi:hypothetical protein